jgi:hypothetical protein
VSYASPKIVDNDRDEITAMLWGAPIRGWSYKDDAERRVKMLAAQEFAEGWYQARKELHRRIGFLLNAHLCCMKPEYDDSITGFNEAWDIVSKVLSEEAFTS